MFDQCAEGARALGYGALGVLTAVAERRCRKELRYRGFSDLEIDQLWTGLPTPGGAGRRSPSPRPADLSGQA